MPAVEERVAHLEGQVSEISHTLMDLREAIRHLEQRFDGVNGRFDALEDKMSRQFMWIVGIQVTSLLAIVTTLGAIVVTLISRV